MSAGFRPYKPRRPGSVQAALTEAFDQAGGLAAAAEAIGRDEKWCYAAADPDIDRRRAAALSYEDARRLSRLPGVTALAEDLSVVSGGNYLPCQGQVAGDVGQLAALLGEESGRALGQLYGDLASGRLTPPAARAELARLREVMRAVNELYCRVSAVGASA